jgi:hypothetical protein
MCSALAHVRFTPNSDRERGFRKRPCLLYPRYRAIFTALKAQKSLIRFATGLVVG